MGTFVTVCLHFRTCTYRKIRYLASEFTTLPRGILLARLFRSRLPNFEDLRPVHRDIEHAWRTLIQRGIRREFPRITFYNGYEPWQVRQRLDLFFPGEVFTFRENLVVAGALQEVDEIEEGFENQFWNPDGWNLTPEWGDAPVGEIDEDPPSLPFSLFACCSSS